LSGFPGTIHVPVLKQLFSNNDQTISQTDIVMLLTPHIVRAAEIKESDLRPVFIGSQQNLGLGGPPPLIAPQPEQTTQAPATPEQQPSTPEPRPPATALRPPAAAPGAPPTPQIPLPPGVTIAPPPGSTPVPGTVLVPAAPALSSVEPEPAAPTGAPATQPYQPPTPAPTPISQAPDTGATTSAGLGMAQVLITPPGTVMRVGGGPYTVPISITNVSRLSTVALTLTYDPKVLRVRAVNEGSFMRSGGANASFTQQVNPANGRVDFTITRSADATGASGTGLLAAILFEAVAPGPATLSVSGAGTGPGGTPMGLQFRPVTIRVE
jgi:hypothetical protein